MTSPPREQQPLQLLSVVIPARDEAGGIAATVEHLHVELRLNGIPHEIIVIDDGSTDNTWDVLQQTIAATSFVTGRALTPATTAYSAVVFSKEAA